MASAVAAVSARPVTARPIVAASAKRSTFYAGSASLSAAPAARTSAAWSPSQRARQAVSVVTARAAKGAQQQITVDVEKPLGLVSRGCSGGNLGPLAALRPPPPPLLQRPVAAS